MKKNITITRTLLDKFYSERTPDENAAVAKWNENREILSDRFEKMNESIRKNCRILCSGYENTPIPAYGWIYPVEKLCYAIEALNIKGKPYGVKVVLDQSKEKFATLRFYTTTHTTEIGWFKYISRPIDWLLDKLGSIDYKYKVVVDKEAYKSVKWTKITPEQFKKRTSELDIPLKNYCKKIKVVKSTDEIKDLTEHETTIFLLPGPAYEYSTLVHHMQQSHREPTKHRLLHWLWSKLGVVSIYVSRFYKEPVEQVVMLNAIDNEVDRLVQEAEAECEKYCEHCGTQLSDQGDQFGSPRCETQGWYSYLCEDCAMSAGVDYRKNGELYLEGKKIPEQKKAKTGKPKKATKK